MQERNCGAKIGHFANISGFPVNRAAETLAMKEFGSPNIIRTQNLLVYSRSL